MSKKEIKSKNDALVKKIVGVDWVKPHPENPRVNAEAVDKVAQNMEKFGQYHELICAPDGTLAIGHTRLMAAKKLNWPTIEVKIMKELKNKTLLKTLMIADNKSSDIAEWDYEKLEQIINSIKDEDEELLDSILFDEEEIEAIVDESIGELEAAYANSADESENHPDRVTTKDRVELVQLYYRPEEREEIIEKTEDLIKTLKVKSMSELVLTLVREKYEEN